MSPDLVHLGFQASIAADAIGGEWIAVGPRLSVLVQMSMNVVDMPIYCIEERPLNNVMIY